MYDVTIHGANNVSIFNGQALSELYFGNEGAETLRGNDGSDRMYGNGGDDSVLGGAGSDTLYGNDGNDTLRGGLDNDAIFAGSGDDFAGGGAGDDTIQGNDGNDLIYGRDGNDGLYGNLGNDTIDGGKGDDSIAGHEGDDFVKGGLGNDLIYGSDGNDRLRGDAGNDTLAGGTGDDTIIGGNDEGVLKILTTKVAPAAPTVSIGTLSASGAVAGDGTLDFNLTHTGNHYTVNVTETGVEGGRFTGEVDFIRGTGSESVTMDFRVDVKNAHFSLEKFYKGEANVGEKMKVTAYDAAGNVLGSDDFAAVNTNGKATFNITDLGTFRSLKFEAADNGIAAGKTDNSDFLLKSVTVDLAAGATTVKSVDSFTAGDQLYGGTGADLFIFGNGYGRGVDVINDFAVGTDKLSLATVVSGFDELMQHHAIDHAGSALFYFGGDGVELHGVALASLQASDFIF